MRSAATALCLIVLTSSAVATGAGLSAVQRFASLRSGMHASRLQDNWGTFRARALDLVRFLNGSPDALLEVARADAHLGNQTGALDALQTIAGMGQSQDVVKTLPDFARLRSLPTFKGVANRMDANMRPVARGIQAFAIPDANLVPEDVDYDSKGRRFLLTSIMEKKIVAIDAHGTLVDFARAPDNWPMVAIKIDTKRNVVWATEVAFDGFSDVPKRDWGRSALVGYNLTTGNMLSRIEGPHASNLGDMTLAANGDLLISDGDGGGVYLEHAAALKRVDAGDFISPQTPALVPGDKVAIVPDYVRGIGVLNLATSQVRWIPMNGKFALEGVDGMYLRDRDVIAVENGTSPERIVIFGLDPTFARIISERAIESATPTLDPTHGVVVGSAFYYIANSGWNELDAAGNVTKGATLKPARIMRAQL
jgi:hypothetical protein